MAQVTGNYAETSTTNDSICQNFQQRNGSSAHLDFFDVVTEITLKQIRKRNQKNDEQ